MTTLLIKKYYFDKILSGEKVFEYRSEILSLVNVFLNGMEQK